MDICPVYVLTLYGQVSLNIFNGHVHIMSISFFCYYSD